MRPDFKNIDIKEVLPAMAGDMPTGTWMTRN